MVEGKGLMVDGRSDIGAIKLLFRNSKTQNTNSNCNLCFDVWILT